MKAKFYTKTISIIVLVNFVLGCIVFSSLIKEVRNSSDVFWGNSTTLYIFGGILFLCLVNLIFAIKAKKMINDFSILAYLVFEFAIPSISSVVLFLVLNLFLGIPI